MTEPSLPETQRRRSVWSHGDTRLYLLLCGAGVVVGLLWRVLGPWFAARGLPSERGIAIDGTLALLQLLAGLVTGGLLIALEGEAPVRRSLLGIAGSLIAGGLSLLAGLATGGPVLQSPAAALVWPVICAVVVFTGTLIAVITVDRHGRRAPDHAPSPYGGSPYAGAESALPPGFPSPDGPSR